MKRHLITALVIVAVLAVAPAATAHHGRAHRRPAGRGATTFSGSCAFSGTVRFEPPLTNTGRPARDFAQAAGTCSGTLTGRRGRTDQLNATPVSYVATDAGSDVTCALSAAATGNGELIFPSAKLRFRLSETRIGAVAKLSLTGSRGGSAVGTANVNTNANPVQIADCAGTGLTDAPVDIHMQTTPTMSG